MSIPATAKKPSAKKPSASTPKPPAEDPTSALFTPLHNGLDFVHSALEHLQGTPDPRGLKYATLHLWSGIEILLKVRLQREHWSLVFADIKSAKRPDYDAGSFKSVSFDDCMTRLEGVADVSLCHADRQKLRSLQSQRNRFEHFGVVGSLQAVQGSAASAISVVLDAILPVLEQDLFSANEKELLGEIRQLIGTVDAVVQRRWQEIKSKVDAAAVVVTCLECTQPAAVPLEGLTVTVHSQRTDPRLVGPFRTV